jgi:hypothetical protein
MEYSLPFSRGLQGVDGDLAVKVGQAKLSDEELLYLPRPSYRKLYVMFAPCDYGYKSNSDITLKQKARKCVTQKLLLAVAAP